MSDGPFPELQVLALRPKGAGPRTRKGPQPAGCCVGEKHWSDFGSRM